MTSDALHQWSFFLAHELHMTVAELLDTMRLDELVGWQAFFAVREDGNSHR